MSLGGEGWMRDEFPERYHEKPCDSFHPYTSNQQLCKCGRPVTEHKTFMAKWNAKRDKEEAYELKRAKLLELSGTEIDGELPEEEIVDLGGGIKLKKSEFLKLRAVAMEVMNRPSVMSSSSFGFPPGIGYTGALNFPIEK